MKNNQGQNRDEFNFDNSIMINLFDFLPVTSVSCVKNEIKLPMSMASCIENAQKLYMTKLTCIENLTFLYMTQTKL
jgi:hypothetical protein